MTKEGLSVMLSLSFSGGYMTNDQVSAAEQIMYRIPISIVRHQLARMRVKPLTEIRIYPEYPTGWHAVVGANNRLYIFTSVYGHITLDIEPVYGTRPNRTLIRRESFFGKG